MERAPPCEPETSEEVYSASRVPGPESQHGRSALPGPPEEACVQPACPGLGSMAHLLQQVAVDVSPRRGSPLKSKLMSMYLPKRLELWLRLVRALPKASSTHVDLSSTS